MSCGCLDMEGGQGRGRGVLTLRSLVYKPEERFRSAESCLGYVKGFQRLFAQVRWFSQTICFAFLYLKHYREAAIIEVLLMPQD